MYRKVTSHEPLGTLAKDYRKMALPTTEAEIEHRQAKIEHGLSTKAYAGPPNPENKNC